MKLKAPEFQVPADDPFKFDLLKRKEIAALLTNLLQSESGPLVLGLNAAWGDGKTTFLRMWQAHLQSNSFRTLYFNAWENDFSESAIVALTAELGAGLSGLRLPDKAKQPITAKLARARALGAGLLKRALPVALKLGTAGALDLDDLTEEALSDFTEQLAEQQIAEYEKAKQSVEGFKRMLAEVAADLVAIHEADKRYPLVIMVDELDRCRPPYAIEILECIKHLFSVPHVVFVIAADRMQLSNAVAVLYGRTVDADGYLRRLIDVDYNLPTAPPEVFCKAQFEKFQLVEAFKQRTAGDNRYDFANFVEFLPALISAVGGSLREQERCFSLLSIALRTTPKDHILWPHLLSTLIVIKVSDPQRFKWIADHSTSDVDAAAKKVLDFLQGNPSLMRVYSDHFGAVVESQLLTCNNRHDRDEVMAQYLVVANNKALERQKEQERAAKILEMYQHRSFRFDGVSLTYFIGRIDLVSNFR